MGISGLLLFVRSAYPIAAKESQEKKKGFDNIYIPKKKNRERRKRIGQTRGIQCKRRSRFQKGVKNDPQKKIKR
jgi:hypothetical protein